MIVFAGVAIAGLALVAADIAQRWISPNGYVQLDIDGHYNIPTWVHATVLSLAAAAAVVASLTFTDNGRRRQWLLIAAALAFFSLDKSVSLHEIAGRNLADAAGVSRDWGSIVWITAWSPLMLGAAFFMFLRIREAELRIQRWVAAGILIAGTKVLMDPFASLLINSGITSETGVIYGIEVNIEESLQLLGFGCLLAGFSQYAIDRVMGVASAETGRLHDGTDGPDEDVIAGVAPNIDAAPVTPDEGGMRHRATR